MYIGVVIVDTKTSVKTIINKLTSDSKSTFSEKVYHLAGEFGIGEAIVQDCLNQLKEENFICEPMCGVLRKI